MKIIECRFAIADDANPVTVLKELTRGMDCIFGGVLLENTGFGHLLASNHVNDTIVNLTGAEEREVAAALLRGA